MSLPCKWYALLCLSAFSFKTFAQEEIAASCSGCCCLKDPTPAGVMISHIHKKNEWMLSYRFMHMGMGKMLSRAQVQTDEKIFDSYLMSSRHMRMDMHMLMAMYGLSDKLTLMGMLNYSAASMQMSMPEGTAHTHQMDGMDMGDNVSINMDNSSSGIGDIKLHALYGLIDGVDHHFVLSAGVSLPTGSIQVKGKTNSMYAGQRLPYNMQLGSGTWDLLPGLTYVYSKDKATFSSQLTAVFRTGYNVVGYKLGNEAVFNSWLSYRWVSWFSNSLRVEGSLADRINGRDPSLYPGNEPSAAPANYGGKRGSAFIGGKIHINTKYLSTSSIGAEYGIPLYQYLNGPQMRVVSTLTISFNTTF